MVTGDNFDGVSLSFLFTLRILQRHEEVQYFMALWLWIVWTRGISLL